MRFLLIISLLFLGAPKVNAQIDNYFGAGNLLTGKTGTASIPNIDSISYNPAQAALIKNSGIQIKWGFQYYEYSLRYPGFPANIVNKFGTNGPLPIPNFILKLTKNIGLSGLVIPFKVEQNIEATDIPMVILNQENKIDITGTGGLDMYVNLASAFAISRAISIGTKFYYVAFHGDGGLKASDAVENADPIANFSISSKLMDIGLGIKFKLGKVLSIGAFSNVYSSSTMESGFSSSLLKNQDSSTSTSEETPLIPEGPQTNSFSTYFNPLRLGIGLKLSKFFLTGDIEYKKVQKDQKMMSIVDFMTKPKDVSDTVSGYFGSEISVSSSTDLLFGFSYEPSSVGPGSRGKDGMVGFGFMDIAMNLGVPPSRPQWMAAAGARFKLIPYTIRVKHKSKKAKKRVLHRNRLLFEAGFAYGETSIGIGSDGEQPGAYLVKRFKFPFTLSYHF